MKVDEETRLTIKSDLGGFVPFNELHAIVSCAATLNFQASSTYIPAFQRQIRKAWHGLDLGIASPSYGVNITFDPTKIGLAINRPIVPEAPALGVELNRSDEEGRILWRVQAMPDSLLVQTFDYVRWLPFFSEVKRLVSAVRSSYDFERLSATKVEYVDRFVAGTIEHQPDVWSVLKQDSVLLNGGILAGENLWHCYTGERFVERGVTCQRSTRVETVDDQRSDGSTARTLTIVTSLQDLLPADFPKGRNMEAYAYESLQLEHAGLKTMLSQILNDRAASRIGLKS